MIIANTFYQHKDIHKYTREYISKSNRTDVRDVRIRRGAELYSDHCLLRAKIRTKSRRKRISIHVGGEKQKIYTSIKSHKLREKEIAGKFKERTEEKIEAWVNTATTTEELWKTFKDIVLTTTRQKCGIKIVSWYKKRRQGGVLSPILFVMIMDDVAKEIKSKIKDINV